MSYKNLPDLRFSGFSGEWERLELKSIAEVNDGLHQTPNYKNEGIPFFSVENLKHMKTKKYISQGDYLKEFKNKSPKKGDILMSRIGSVGETNIINDNVPLAFYVTLALLRPNKKLNSIFFNYLLKSPTVQIEIWRRTLHVAFPKKINKNEISKIQLNISDEIEQQKIGDFFAKQDKLIEFQTQKVDQLKKLKRGYLQKMFPQDGERVPRLRFSGFSGDWKKETLGDKLCVKMGQSPHSENYTDDNKNSILVQGNADILNGKIKPRVYTKEITRTSKKNEIIMTVRAPVGELAFNQFDNVVIGRGVASLSGNKFDYYSLVNIKNNGLWKRFSSGSTFDSINSSDIKLMTIKVPNEDEQQKIGNFFSKLDKLIKQQSRKLYQLKQQKKAYLQKMFI